MTEFTPISDADRIAAAARTAVEAGIAAGYAKAQAAAAAAPNPDGDT